MENGIAVEPKYVTNNQTFDSFMNLTDTTVDLIGNSQIDDVLSSEGHENFVSYLEILGYGKEQNPVVLSSLHHYYYDAEEMKNVKTVINLKELNLIKHIKHFLHSVFRILPPKSKLIGCFVDNKKVNGYVLRNYLPSHIKNGSSDAVENGIVSRIPFLNMLYSIMDSRTNNYMSKSSVTLLLKDHGFKVLDMTELHGITFFCAQSLKTVVN